MPDVVVVGAGVNGLTAACYLARAGRQVSLLAHGAVGGMASRHEFHPGYRSSGILTETTQLRRWVVDDLELEKHGLRYAPSSPVVVMGGDQQLVLGHDSAATRASIARLSEKDADSYGRYLEFYQRIERPIAKLLNSIPADVVELSPGDLWSMLKRGVQLRRLGKNDMLEVLRLAPMAVYDWLDEWFESDLLKAGLALPAVTESYSAPWSPGTNANLLIRQVCQGNDVEGGGLALIDALVRAARGFGVSIQEDERVEQILPGRGVRTEGGSIIEASTIVAGCDPKTVFLKLLDRNTVNHQLEQRIRNYRARGLSSQLLLALDTPPTLPGETEADRIRFLSSLDGIEKSFDPIKFGELPERPSLEMYLPSRVHQDLAPAGHAVASVMIHYTPYELAGGWQPTDRDGLIESTLRVIEESVPGFSRSVVGSQLLTPRDIEERYGTSGGHVLHGEHGIDQLLVRPTPECSRYKTPFEGLYLCSGGTFPGGGLTCAPGALAARAILD